MTLLSYFIINKQKVKHTKVCLGSNAKYFIPLETISNKFHLKLVLLQSSKSAGTYMYMASCFSIVILCLDRAT